MNSLTPISSTQGQLRANSQSKEFINGFSDIEDLVNLRQSKVKPFSESSLYEIDGNIVQSGPEPVRYKMVKEPNLYRVKNENFN